MGYDMYWAQEPPDTDELAQPYLEASTRYNAALEARDRYVEQQLGMSSHQARKIQYNAAEARRTDVNAGKNMTAVLPSPEEEEKARAFWEANSKLFVEDPEAIRLQEEVVNAGSDMDRAKRWYFRANIWGMGMLREFMDQSGMIDWEAEMAQFPDEESFDIPLIENKVGDETYTVHDEESEQYQRYDQAVTQALQQQSENLRGIPGFKIGDNSGWWITPDEIRVAVALHDAHMAAGKYDWRFYDHAGRQFQKWLEKTGSELANYAKPEEVKEDPAEIEGNKQFFLDWVEFLREAANHGGVRVY